MIISVTMVRNEADIIEPFVRHNLSLVDVMVFLDNGSSDETARIIFSLIREGLPVHYIFDPDPRYVQDVITSALFHAVVQHFSPDFVFPLDVDEFIVSVGGICSTQALTEAIPSHAISLIPWITYVPNPADAVTHEPLANMTLRRSIEPKPVFKTIIPTQLVGGRSTFLKQGNHDIISSLPVRRQVLDGFALAHFPLRTVEQLRRKAVIGWLGNLAKGRYSLFDWYAFYSTFKQGQQLDEEQLLTFAARKDIPSDIESPTLDRASPFPLPLRRYPVGRQDLTNLLLSYCEDLIEACVGFPATWGVLSDRRGDERWMDYVDQLGSGALPCFVEDCGLSVLETLGLVRVMRTLPRGARVAVLGETARKISGLVSRLSEEAGTSRSWNVIGLADRDTVLGSRPSGVDLLVGNISETGLSSADGPKLLESVAKGGWAVFTSVDICPLTRELVETWVSPDERWGEKGLVRGTYFARSLGEDK